MKFFRDHTTDKGKPESFIKKNFKFLMVGFINKTQKKIPSSYFPNHSDSQWILSKLIHTHSMLYFISQIDLLVLNFFPIKTFFHVSCWGWMFPSAAVSFDSFWCSPKPLRIPWLGHKLVAEAKPSPDHVNEEVLTGLGGGSHRPQWRVLYFYPTMMVYQRSTNIYQHLAAWRIRQCELGQESFGR